MNLNLNTLPKQFCESVTIGYSKEFFALALLSGQNVNAFALTPEHAKRTLLSLKYHVEEFEKSFGEIQADWSPGVESPIQMVDLTKPKK